MLTFCTLFDSGYLSRGLAMYFSLERVCSDFHLYIFAFDDACCRILEGMQLNHATVVSLGEFEDERLLEVKPTRGRGEYCWTATSSTILYVLEHFEVDHCTYIDSDLYFYASPQPLIDAMGEASVSIIPHRYTAAYDQGDKTGIYCVQFMTFKKTEEGLTVLKWWRDACLDWCYARFEEGRFGDQKYLDDWPIRFRGVKVLTHLGGGVAPWNMQQYSFVEKNGSIEGREISSSAEFSLIFFHFHSFMFVTPDFFSPRPYYKRVESVHKLIFKPYICEIKRIRQEFPLIAATERYLKGVKLIKYLAEVAIRRGFKEYKFIKMLS